MPGRLGPRFALEAVFLIALAVAMGLADLSATAIIVVMAVAWLLVAVVEWLASRGPDYGGQSWNRPAGPLDGDSVTEIVAVPQSVEDADTEDPIELDAPPEAVSGDGEAEESRPER